MPRTVAGSRAVPRPHYECQGLPADRSITGQSQQRPYTFRRRDFPSGGINRDEQPSAGSGVVFNLLVGLPARGGTLERDRVFEGTSAAVRTELQASGDELAALIGLPTLAMPELSPGDDQVARVGQIARITPAGPKDYSIVFSPNPHIAPIPSAEVFAMLDQLDVANIYSLHRTYLGVKDVDLYQVLLERDSVSEMVRPSRTYLNFPTSQPVADLVAVMMPFKDHLKPVYETMRRTSHAEGLRCQRADDIWKNYSIMDDIVSLLWSASIVIVDYTDTNSNVFYELGITHTLGRPSIPITQDTANIPFDLRGNRALEYTTTPLGLDKLAADLAPRIRGLSVLSL